MPTEPRSVLLVDDEPGIRRVFGNALELAGYRVNCAANGREAIRLLKSVRFDVVVTDILMPEADGLEVLMHLRGMEARPKVIPMSGGGSMVSASEALDLAVKMGTEPALKKPLSAESLLAAVRGACDATR